MTLLKAVLAYQWASRALTLQAIRDGRIMVDGEVMNRPNRFVVLESTEIAVDGVQLERKSIKPRTIVFNKPHGVVTSREEGCTTVYSFLHNRKDWTFPIGGLPKHASGIVIVTNDSSFADQVANPFKNFTSDIFVKVHRPLKRLENNKVKKALAEIWKDDDVLDVTVAAKTARGAWIKIESKTGRLQDIYTVLKSLQLEPVSVERRRVGPFTTDRLSKGAWFSLTDEESDTIRQQSESDTHDTSAASSLWSAVSKRLFSSNS